MRAKNFLKYIPKYFPLLVLTLLFGCNAPYDADQNLQISPVGGFNNPGQTYQSQIHHAPIYQQPYYQQPYYQPSYQYPNSQFYSNPYIIMQPSQYPYYDYDQYYIPPNYYSTEPIYKAPKQGDASSKF